jgi:hypothetical protein
VKAASAAAAATGQEPCAIALLANAKSTRATTTAKEGEIRLDALYEEEESYEDLMFQRKSKRMEEKEDKEDGGEEGKDY